MPSLKPDPASGRARAAPFRRPPPDAGTLDRSARTLRGRELVATSGFDELAPGGRNAAVSRGAGKRVDCEREAAMRR
jgi:hypothetical protein